MGSHPRKSKSDSKLPPDSEELPPTGGNLDSQKGITTEEAPRASLKGSRYRDSRLFGQSRLRGSKALVRLEPDFWA